MKLAVVANAGKTLGGGLPELRRTLEEAGVSDAALVRGAEEQAGAARGQAGAGGRRRSDPRLGRGRDGAALRQRARGHAGSARDRSRWNLEPVRHEPRHRARHRASRAGRAARRPPPAGRRLLRRRALRRDGRGRLRRGDDQGRRRPERPSRPRGLRARRGRKAQRRELRGEDQDRRDALVQGARRAASWSETSATCSAASRCSPTRSPTTALLDVGVLTSEGPVQLVRAVTRTALGSAEKSPFVRATQGRKVRVKLDRKVRYELDGGDRKKVKSFKVDVEAGAITVCVPARGTRRKRSEMSQTSDTDPGPQRQGETRGRRACGREAARLARASGPRRPRRSSTSIIGVLALKLALGDGGKATNQQGALKTIADRPFGEVLLILRRDRTGGLRALEADPRRRRPWRRTARQRVRPGRCARERHRIRDPLRDGGEDPHGFRHRLGDAEGGDRWRPGMVGRHGPRRDRRRRPHRRRRLPGLQGSREEVPRRREDGRNERRRPQGLHRARRLRPSRSGRHLRADRLRADQGGDRLRPEGSDRARRRATQARRMPRLALRCWVSSPPGWPGSRSTRWPTPATARCDAAGPGGYRGPA